MTNYNDAAELVKAADDIVIVTHLSPDGDAIGSLLGLAWALRQMGKRVTVADDDGVPTDLRFLPGANEVKTALTDVSPDLVIAVDCGDQMRMGKVGAAAVANGAPLINIDHHITNTQFGQVNLVDTGTVATAEGIYDWLPYLGVTIDERIATCLLTGIVTDTLGFRTDNVRAGVLGKAEHLMQLGAPLNAIARRTVNRKSYTDLRLWSIVLPTVKLEKGIIWAIVDRATRDTAHLNGNGDGGLVGVLISVDEANVAAVFRELDDGRVEVGLRARPNFDVSKTALALGGGGHALASGATVDGPLGTAVDKTLKLLKKAIREGKRVD